MSSDDVQRLYDSVSSVLERLVAVETKLTTLINAPIDVSRLRWDGKALNYVIVRVIAPILITVLLGGSAFYYGIHMQIGELSVKVTQHIEKTER